MKNAIITGATGFVGTHLAALLEEKGVEVTGYDCRRADISSLARADVFYHLAWEGAVGLSRSDAPLQARNAELTLKMLTTAHRLGCGRFIALGTVYERFVPGIIASCVYRNSDFYILSKDYAHTSANQLAHRLGMDFVWCTICHPIGRFIKPEQMVAYVISSLLSGVPPAFGTAQTYYDIIDIRDAASGLYLLGCADKLSKREYYVGSGKPKPLYMWLDEVRSILKTDVPINFGANPDDGMYLEEKWFDIADMAMDTGYAPSIDFAQAVKFTAQWVKEKV